jgi:peptide/nickel transport system permease protein
MGGEWARARSPPPTALARMTLRILTLLVALGALAGVVSAASRVSPESEARRWLRRLAVLAVLFVVTAQFLVVVEVVSHPLPMLLLSFGIPALGALTFVFVRGTASLRRYILVRTALTLPMVLILATMVFVVLRVLPGDPVTSTLGPRGTPALRQQMTEQLGLNRPIIAQYGDFLWRTVRLDLGNALTGGQRPIADELGERLPATVELVIPAAALALLLGIIPGTFAASRRKKPSDYALRMYSVVVYSMPVFWLGLILQLIFGVRLGWLPVAGRIDPIVGTTLERTTNLLMVDSALTANWAAMASAMKHLVLPTLTLGLILSTVFLRLTRINVMETLQQDYVASLRSRGIRERSVIYKHALKNAMIPVITLIGLQVAILLGGAVLTETVFSWPGMGRYLVDRIGLRDYTAVQSVIVMFALMVAMISLAVDVIYSMLDPRVKY